MDITPFLNSILERFFLLLNAPLNYQDMIWILTPLIITLLLVEFYFGRYVQEEFGWHTAFTNSLVLIFVSLNLAQHLYQQDLLVTDLVKTAIIIGVFVEGIILSFIDFFHILPKRFAYQFSSAIPINFIAYMAIILVYTNIPIDYITGIAFFVIFAMLSTLIAIIHIIEPKVRTTLNPPEPEAPD